MNRPLALVMALALLAGWATAAQAISWPAQRVDGQQPVIVLITGLRYDAPNAVYRLSLSVSDPQAVWRLVLTVEESEGGTLVDGAGAEVDLRGRSTVQVDLNAANFKGGRKYLVRVQAVDFRGAFLQKPDDTSGARRDPSEATILAAKEFLYEREVPKAVEFKIESINALYDTGQLVIDLDVPDADRVLKFEGFVVDKSGQRILNFGPSLFDNRRLQVDLPAVMRQQPKGEPAEYKVTVYLTTRDDLRSQAVFEGFKPVPPPPPGVIQVAATALRQNPVIQAGVVAIVLIVVCWRIFAGRRSDADLLARPPYDRTRRVQSGARQPHLRLRIVQSPDPAHGTEQTITHFPCVIGRQESDINLPADRQISRHHLEISLREGQFYVTDLGSTNGTYVEDTALSPHSPRRLDTTTCLRLGAQTYLEIEPEQ